MKIAKFFAWLFGILGTAVMVLAIGLCLISLNTQAEMKEVPEGAARCAETLMEAVAAGDFTAAAKCFYGQPDLGTDRGPGAPEGVMIYDAFRSSLSYEWKGNYYAVSGGIARDVAVTYLELPSVTKNLDRRVQDLMNERVAKAEDVSALYDETHKFREDLVADVLTEAVVRCLAEDGVMATQELTVNLVYRDGQWQAVLDSAMLLIFAGGRA